ncbi:MAG: NUDIX domain-containing protein [Candidatus Levybacteria bacterium]|nr:NUDIX domain-containing protein [Candidatus Levybacteria bacterium]
MRLFQTQFLVGITGVILNDKNEVLLFKHTYRSGNAWSLPGGYMKAREHPLEGLEREIEEESGLIVSADENVRIRTDRNSSRLDITVTGKFMGGEFKPSAEVVEYGFFTLSNLPKISKNQHLLIHQVLS